EDEQRRKPEVQQPYEKAVARRDAVVVLRLRMPSELPAPPQLRGGEQQDDDQDRVRPVDDEREQAEKADEPERRVQRSRDAPAVERDHRQQVEEVDEEAQKGERLEVVRVVRDA